MEKTIEEALEMLYANNQSKLKQMCKKEMMRFGGLLQKDYDDFYSRAGYELDFARRKYNPSDGNLMML